MSRELVTRAANYRTGTVELAPVDQVVVAGTHDPSQDEVVFWTAERTAALCRLWDAGRSTALIARELGTTKNAVVGKVNRLHLTPRPPPIRRSATR